MTTTEKALPLVCAFCTFELPGNQEAQLLWEHIAQCGHHPLGKANAQLAITIRIMEDMIDVFGASPCRLTEAGYCREHDWYEDDRSCPIGRAMEYLGKTHGNEEPFPKPSDCQRCGRDWGSHYVGDSTHEGGYCDEECDEGRTYETARKQEEVTRDEAPDPAGDIGVGIAGLRGVWSATSSRGRQWVRVHAELINAAAQEGVEHQQRDVERVWLHAANDGLMVMLADGEMWIDPDAKEPPCLLWRKEFGSQGVRTP